MARMIGSDERFGDAVLTATQTTGETLEVQRGGMYQVIVVGQPAGATLGIDVWVGGAWVAAGSIGNTDLSADGAAFSGSHAARLGCGRWRFTASVAGAVAYLAPAGVR